MPIKLDDQQVVVLVFAMHECPACEHYLPRFVAEANALNQRLAAQGVEFVINPEAQPAPHVIPVLVFDAAAPDPEVQKIADRFGVTATPTTIVATRGPGSFKLEGSLANNQIQWVLLMASEARSYR